MTADKNLYDMIIIGAGPAGLSAAIYMARAKYNVLVLEKKNFGGQITITAEVVNYPGVKSTNGNKLTENMKKQAMAFGAEFKIAEVMNMKLESDIKTLSTTDGEYKSLSIVLAVGANPRTLGFKGEKEFQGRGVAYCATCDGEFFAGMNIFVIGGGFAAVEEGIFLTKYAKHVKLIVREPNFTCAKTISDKLKEVNNIDYVFNTEVKEITGDTMPKKITFINNENNNITEYEAEKDGPFGVFVFAGYVPNTGWLPKSINLNEQHYIITDRNQKTSIEGVYAAGDVCVKNLRQVVTAVSDGAIAATSAEKHVEDMHKKLNLPDCAIIHKSRDDSEKKDTQNFERGFFDESTREQLKTVFEKFDNHVVLKAWLDDSSLSGEIIGFLNELTSLTDKALLELADGESPYILPSIEICDANGKGRGIAYHGVPGGHEINSFIMAMYNVAGPGKELDNESLKQIKNIDSKTNIKILVSLSCTMCPETVISAQTIAAHTDKVDAEMLDIMHFPQIKEKYNVMSVPCMIINDNKTVFGKKNISEVLQTISS